MRQKRLTNTDIAGAQTLYDKALKFNSDHPTVLYNYAVLLEDARQAETQFFYFPPPFATTATQNIVSCWRMRARQKLSTHSSSVSAWRASSRKKNSLF